MNDHGNILKNRGYFYLTMVILLKKMKKVLTVTYFHDIL